jgi:multidrug efflux pump subunit AcrA (membrane-fusion protein)
MIKETFEVDSIVPILSKDTSVVVYNGIIKPAVNVNLTFSIDGVLMRGDFPLEVGKIVHENDILFKLDLRQLFKELSAKKMDLKARAEGLNQEIAANQSDQKDSWNSFTLNILPTKRLPALPAFTKKSKNPLIESFTKAYDDVERLEARTEDYYVFAPFSGTIVSVNKKIGERIQAGECVAQLAPFQIYYAQFKISKADLGLIKQKDEVSLFLNKEQLQGRVTKISLSKDSNYAMVQCGLSKSVENRSQKIILKLRRNSEFLYIPSHLLRNDSLWIFRQGRSMKIHTTILEWKKDSVAIKELKPGDIVLQKRQKSRAIACF